MQPTPPPSEDPGAGRPPGEGGEKPRGMGAAVAIGVLVVLGLLLGVFALGLADNGDEDTDGNGSGNGDTAGREAAPGAGVTPEEPLRLLPVEEALPGACGEPGQDAFTTPDGNTCLTVVTDEGLVVEELAAVEVVDGRPQGIGTVVEVTLVEADAGALADLTGDVAARSDPGNRLAVVLGEELLMAPTVVERLESGGLHISGVSHEEAEELADRLGG
ncbi:hypothetical protein GCM10027160_41660 [Streptomyces calidiresistens]|uniref:SecDF P1 head subdomain domain-containing protein n=1 Tax=Streptomyces calidiresistens TaxID=1485586 RepID=A0A7W3XYI1_9ACTN|nr:hypothetical protein [Streptomyces calidiresistens]MBB0231998.1 hypothetical protein [Streptomyces calidiresistens]